MINATLTNFEFFDVLILKKVILPNSFNATLQGQIGSKTVSWAITRTHRPWTDITHSDCMHLQERCKKLGSQIGMKPFCFESLLDKLPQHVHNFFSRVRQEEYKSTKRLDLVGFEPQNTLLTVYHIIHKAIPSCYWAPMAPYSCLAKIRSARGQKWHTRFSTLLDKIPNQMDFIPICVPDFLHLPY